MNIYYFESCQDANNMQIDKYNIIPSVNYKPLKIYYLYFNYTLRNPINPNTFHVKYFYKLSLVIIIMFTKILN